ncbi:MAG: hypothetical protein G01um101413_513 [Parcubacteria group bacterium Gr01-1014_13]|nr:MAG: hypothetical protein G01um101413_513 [Parcubacteria group bacterium Gr01-1014_13]
MFRVKHLSQKMPYTLDKLSYLYTLVYTIVHLTTHLYTELSTFINTQTKIKGAFLRSRINNYYSSGT